MQSFDALILNKSAFFASLTRHSMPKANQEPDPNRRQTHATNATAHPGKVVLEVLADRRPQEDIENDKKAKQARCEARERKKIGKAKAIKSIADFENEMALDDEIRKTTFPRYQTEGKHYDSSVVAHHAPAFSECPI